MITKQILKKWPVALALGLTMTIISCGEDEPSEVAPADFAYPASTVDVGTEGSVAAPTVEGGGLTFELFDDGGADFITVDAATGDLTIAAESATGTYEVVVTATNSQGSSNGSATVTIGVSDAFNPIGKALHATYFINQQEGLTLTGLDGVPGLPFPELTLPTGWPSADTPAEEAAAYFILTGIEQILFNVPAETVCGEGNTLGPVLVVAEDLSIVVPGCQEGDPSNSIGVAEISYADGGYALKLDLTFVPGVNVPYTVSGANFADFTDPLTGETYEALMGTVLAATVPTDLTDESTIQDVSKWALATIDIVFAVQD